MLSRDGLGRHRRLGLPKSPIRVALQCLFRVNRVGIGGMSQRCQDRSRGLGAPPHRDPLMAAS